MDERKAGRISADQSYRLPSDLEWGVAVGVERKAEARSINEALSGESLSVGNGVAATLGRRELCIRA